MNEKKSNYFIEKLIAIIFLVGLVAILAGIVLTFIPNSFVLRLFDGERFLGICSLLGICFAYLLIGGMLINKIIVKNLFKISRELVAVVKVVSKESDSKSYSLRGIRLRGDATFYIAFEFSNGERKNFIVDIEKFNTILKDDFGTLTYKEHGKYLFFVDFKRQF